MNVPGAIGWALIGASIALNFEQNPFGSTILAAIAGVGYLGYHFWRRKGTDLPNVHQADDESEDVMQHTPELGWGELGSNPTAADQATHWRLPTGTPVILSADPPEAFEGVESWLNPERLRQIREGAEAMKARGDAEHAARSEKNASGN